MNRLFDQCAILLLCLPGFLLAGSLAMPVVALLLAVLITTAAQLLAGRKAAWAILLVGCSLCGVLPLLFCALPLFLYDALCEHKWWLVLPALTIAINISALSTTQILCIGTAALATFLWQQRTERLERSVERLTQLRDGITEENLQLTAQNRKLFEVQDSEIHVATLRERNRIAREIHDNVGHMLTRSILQTGAMQVINTQEALREPLNELKNTLDGAMTSIRASVHDLHDESIDLQHVLREMISSVDAKFDAKLQYDAGEHIPGELKLCVAGIVREGISNAVKHSNGDRIDVIFREHPAFFQLLVEDNGSNPDDTSPEQSARGIGLRNMRERAEAIGGHITFTASAHGFRIFMTVPKK